MKKVAIVLVLTLIGLFNINISKVEAVSYSADQTFNPVNNDRNVFQQLSTSNLPEGSIPLTTLCQSFTPSRSVLADYVDALIYGNVEGSIYEMRTFKSSPDGMFPDNNFPLDNNYDDDILDSIYEVTSLGSGQAPNVDNSLIGMTRFTNKSGNDVNVTPGEKYWLCLSWGMDDWEAASGKIMSWYGSTNNLYSRGRAVGGGPFGGAPYSESVTETTDFGFVVYSQETAAAQTPADENEDNPTLTTTPTATTPAASTPLPTGVTAGSGAAPATPTTSIKAPSELVAADVPADQGGSLKLDWKASTTADIAGYKIFRSTEEKKGFTEIAKTTDKTIITYTDNTAAIGQKYYYLVRAYKDAKESASSNTVNGTSADNLAPAAPQHLTFAKTSRSIYTFTWDKNSEPDLAGYVLTISNNAEVVETIEIAKDAASYELKFADHEKIKSSEEYSYALAAKDSNSNISEKTLATEVTAEKAAKNNENAAGATDQNNTYWYIVGGVVLLLIAGGLYYWFKFRKKKIKLNTKPDTDVQ